MYCQSCGKELAPGATYCHNCGARVGEYSPVDWWTWRSDRWERRVRDRHDWEPVDAAWGAVRGVGYLIIIGLAVFWYPDVFTLIIKYLESWGTFGHPVLPSHSLGVVIIFVLATGGIWGIVTSGLRLVLTTRVARSLRGVVGGVFSLYVALIFNQFYARNYSGAGLVLLFFVGLAGMVLADAMIWHFMPRRRGPKQGQTVGQQNQPS